MGKRKDLPASFDSMERRFMDAIERINEGEPLCPELADKAKIGKLKLTVSGVALEAGGFVDGKWKGVSRTLIGHAKCRYPSVHAKITRKDETVAGNNNDLRSINRNLREQNRELERRWKLAISEMGAMSRKMEAREKEIVDKIEETVRVQARGGRNANSMHEMVIGDNISSIRKSKRDS